MMTHSVEHCRADGSHNEAVIQAQFLQVLIEVIWIHNQMRNYSLKIKNTMSNSFSPKSHKSTSAETLFSVMGY